MPIAGVPPAIATFMFDEPALLKVGVRPRCLAIAADVVTSAESRAPGICPPGVSWFGSSAKAIVVSFDTVSRMARTLSSVAWTVAGVERPDVE